MPDPTSYPLSSDTVAGLPYLMPLAHSSRPEVRDFLVPLSEYGKRSAGDILVADQGGRGLAFRPLGLKTVPIPEAPGFTGTPRTLRLSEDNGLTVCLLLSMAALIFVWARSVRYLHPGIRAVFHKGLFSADETARTGKEWQGLFVLILIACFSLSILYYAHLGDVPVPFLRDLPSGRIIARVTGILLVYFLLKVLLYAMVNAVFFSRTQSRDWMETYLLVMAGSAFVLLPLALFVTCVGMDVQCRLYALSFVAVLGKSVLFFRCNRTFFPAFRHSVHLFLYFCTFEIFPALVLWRVLFWAVSYAAFIQ